MKTFKGGDHVIVTKGIILSYGTVCSHRDDKDWITVHVVNGKQGEFVHPKYLKLASVDDYRRKIYDSYSNLPT